MYRTATPTFGTALNPKSGAQFSDSLWVTVKGYVPVTSFGVLTEVLFVVARLLYASKPLLRGQGTLQGDNDLGLES